VNNTAIARIWRLGVAALVGVAAGLLVREALGGSSALGGLVAIALALVILSLLNTVRTRNQ
jgi:hypothetical protein